jgi:uncharacterized protein YcbX
MSGQETATDAASDVAGRGRVGTVAAVWRFPVKSMQGELLDAGEVTRSGVVGDRAYALVDTETGKVVSAKHPKKWSSVLACRARFLEQPVAGEEPPPVQIDLPDGTTVISDAPDAAAALSRFFGRSVELAAAAPSDYTIDQYHPDLDYDPEHRDELIDQKLGAAYFNELGEPPPVPDEAFVDLFPISVLATSTLERLAELQPGSDFDVRRFRMNVIVDTPESGFVENGWVGRQLEIGPEVRLNVELPDPRCVMPSLAQPGLDSDREVLRTLAKHNRLDLGGMRYPCAGVYAVAESPGTVGRGEEVKLV